MPNLGPTELIIVLVLVIIIFGVGKLPEVGGALGKSIREFRKANDESDEKAKQEEVARLEVDRSLRDEPVRRELDRGVQAEPAPKETVRKE